MKGFNKNLQIKYECIIDDFNISAKSEVLEFEKHKTYISKSYNEDAENFNVHDALRRRGMLKFLGEVKPKAKKDGNMSKNKHSSKD